MRLLQSEYLSPGDVNAPVKVNLDIPHPGICGALVGLYHHIGSSLSPQYVGDSRVLSLLALGMRGISRGFVLIQDGGDRFRKDFWVHFGTLERTQVFTGIFWNPFDFYSNQYID